MIKIVDGIDGNGKPKKFRLEIPMKFIRTENGIYNIKENGGIFTITKIYEATRYANGELQQEGDRLVKIQGKDYKITNDNVADTIEELCDVYIYWDEKKIPSFPKIKPLYLVNMLESARNEFESDKQLLILGKQLGFKCWLKLAIWTYKGLIYVAKLNDEGDLELL